MITNRHIGKVARLPDGVRDRLNQMLVDGKRYREIIAWLAAEGYGQFTKMNLHHWRKRGFQEWLAGRERLEELEYKLELALKLGERGDGGCQKALVALAQLKFFDALNRSDGSALARLAQEKPAQMLQILKTFVSFSRLCLAAGRQGATAAPANGQAKHLGSPVPEADAPQTADLLTFPAPSSLGNQPQGTAAPFELPGLPPALAAAMQALFPLPGCISRYQ